MTILTYHAVDPEWSAPLSVTPALFERHLDWIEANRRVLTLEELLDGDGATKDGDVAITFDDGFTSVAEHALPALRTRGMRATVFVVGKMLDASGGTIDWVDHPPQHRLSVFDRETIVELHREGIGFGCHSYAHRDLTTLGYEACLEDLRRGRDILQDLLGEEVTTLAYPFGRHDAQVRRAALEAGFRWSFAMATPPRAPGAHAIPRVGVYPNDDLARLRMKTHSWYAWLRSSAAYPALHRLRATLRTRDRPLDEPRSLSDERRKPKDRGSQPGGGERMLQGSRGAARLAYVQPPERITRTADTAPGSGPLTQIHHRRAEGISTRRLVLALDVVVLGSFVAIVPRPATVVYVALVLLALKSVGIYGARLMPRVSDDLPRILAAVGVPAIVLPWIGSDPDALHLAQRLPALLLALVLGRSLTYWVLHRARATGLRLERVLIVGAGEHGRDLARILVERPRFGLEPVGFLDEAAIAPLPHPLLGGVDDLPRLIAVHGIDRVIVAEWEGDDEDLMHMLRACTEHRVHVHVAPRLFQLGTAPSGPFTDWVWTTPLVRLAETPQRTRAWQGKRLMDVVVAIGIGVLTTPVWVAAAVAVRLSSPGPVLFRQIRVTEGGRLFELRKFRTMPVNAGSDTRWGDGGERPTRAGSFMRRTGIDELPQLVNVLRGEMSLVGPRPERPFFVERFEGSIEGYRDRLRVPAGLTGWAQVHGLRGETSIQERVMFDNEYIEYWSLWRDVVILVRTVKAFLVGEGR